MTDHDRRPIGPGEAARRLGVSTRTVQRWLREGRLPAVRVGGRVKVDASAFEPGPRVGGPAGHPPTVAPPIRRLLIANRGEPVVRIARTARRIGITVCGLVAEGEPPDASWLVALDTIVRVPGYLDREAILRAALASSIDAVHPGWGFLAEDAAFAEAVEAAGMAWVGPPAAAMRALGDKAAARRMAQGLGIPTLPGYDGDDQADATLAREAARIGYPVLLKPSAGGGGKGMHVVRSPAEGPEALSRARREARSSFGDDRMVLERYVEAPRHVEIQLLFDAFGHGVHLGERECSLQRRHQKVIEESPSPNVTPAVRSRLGEWALALGREAGYQSAGTAEFLLTQDGEPYFLELNARLQVEHPVTEMVTGRDLVEDQLRIAQGEPLGIGQDHVRFAGHAIEARLYAEDPWAGFMPSGGRIAAVRWPQMPGLRIDAGFAADPRGSPHGEWAGDEVSTRYDPMIAKLIATGEDRAASLRTLRDAVAELRVHGITTNRGFLRWLLGHPPVVDGTATTATIDADWQADAPTLADDAWSEAAAALLEFDDHQRAGFRVNASPTARIEVAGESRTVAIGSSSGEWVLASADDRLAATVDLDGLAVTARLVPPPAVDSAVSHATRAAEGGQTVTAPMPGTILAVRVADGDDVEAHQVLVLLEAMKMENAVTAPAEAVVRRVLVQPGQAVSRGQPLIELA